MNEYSEEFKFWYERFFLQSPSLCALKYDDEKMWEAWKAAQRSLVQMIRDNHALQGAIETGGRNA